MINKLSWIFIPTIALLAAASLPSLSRGQGLEGIVRASAGHEVVVDRVWVLDRDTAIDADTTLRFTRCGMLVLSQGVAFKFSGVIEAGPVQIFQVPSNSSIDLRRSRINHVYPEWFGAGLPTRRAEEQILAFQQAVNAAAGKVLVLSCNDYYIKNIDVRSECSIEGTLPMSSRVHMIPGADYGLNFDVPSLANIRLKDFFLDVNSEAKEAIQFPYGLKNSLLSSLVISGKGEGSGIVIRGVHPQKGPNTNSYQTEICGCNLYNLATGIHLMGRNVPGGHANLNYIWKNTFSRNKLCIFIEHGALNVIGYNDFNPTRGGVDRVLIKNVHGNNLFVNNYWDDIGLQVAVHYIGFQDAGQYAALTILNDNLPIDKFRVDVDGGRPMGGGGDIAKSLVQYMDTYNSDLLGGHRR